MPSTTTAANRSQQSLLDRLRWGSDGVEDDFPFSAPEQVRRDYGNPTPAMDYYAVGQVLYWAVTGNTVRGTSHVPMRQVAPELGRFDPLIDALVRQDPSERPASVEAVQSLIEPVKRTPEDERYWTKRRVQDTFDDALSRGLPGSWGAVETPDGKLDRVLEAVADVAEEVSLYFITERGESNAHPMFRDGDVGVIGNNECSVSEAWMLCSPTAERQFVMLRLRGMDPFPVRGYRATGDSDEASFFDGQYIRREEYDQRCAEVDGEVIETAGAELRIRLLNESVVALAPSLSVPVMGGDRDGPRRQREALMAEIGAAESITEEAVKRLASIERPWWVSMYD